MDKYTFVKGLRVYRPNAKAPDFVAASGEIELNELIKFAKENDELLTGEKGAKKLRFKVLISNKDGSYYAIVDTFKPSQQIQATTTATPVPQPPQEESDLPF